MDVLQTFDFAHLPSQPKKKPETCESGFNNNIQINLKITLF